MRKTIIFRFAVSAILAFHIESTRAGSATWKQNPGSNDWNTPTNWTPDLVPNGASDIATFGVSTRTNPSGSALIEVNKLLFGVGASAYTITWTSQFLTISGVGIVNNSGTTQTFVASATSGGFSPTATIRFVPGASAGISTLFVAKGAIVSGGHSGEVDLRGGSTADHATFVAEAGGVSGAIGGVTTVRESSTAANGTFTSNGPSVSGALSGGDTAVLAASAGNASFTNNGATANSGGGGRTILSYATAENASFANHGGSVNGAEGGKTVVDESSVGHSIFANNPALASGATSGQTIFQGSSNAEHGTITNNGANMFGAAGGLTEFFDNSSAGDATVITNGGGANGANPGITRFHDNSSAGDAAFTINGPTAGLSKGLVEFRDNSTAANATLIANASGGRILISDQATGGASRIEVFGNGIFDIRSHSSGGVAVGSLEGDGNVFLGGRNLEVGGNGISTSFSGIINVSGPESLTKIGSGTLKLLNANSFNGGTTIAGGTLEALRDGALGGGPVNLSTPGAALTLQSAANNNYIDDFAILSLVSGSTVNLNFSGNADTISALIVDGMGQVPGEYGSAASGAEHPIQEFTGTGRLLVTEPIAVSRKINGAGAFDLLLLPRNPGTAIECRDGGPSNQYQIVVTFLNPVTFSNATVTSGNGMVTNTSGSGTKVVTISLGGVTNAQTIVVTLNGLSSGAPFLNIPMGVLVGDTTGNGSVNASDVSQIKAESGHAVTNANFRADVTANGSITGSDVSFVKSKVGTALP